MAHKLLPPWHKI